MNIPVSERSAVVTVAARVFIILDGLIILVSIARNLVLHTRFPLDEMRAQTAAAQKAHQMPPMAGFMFD